MIHVIIVKNPFERRIKEEYTEKFTSKQAKDFKSFDGLKVYAVNGVPCNENYIPKDGEELLIMPKIEKKAFGWILTIGLTVLSAGIAGGAAWAFGANTWSLWARIGASMAVTFLGNALSSKLSPAPKIDLSNAEQSNTYGWNGMQSLTGQGQALPIVYGTVKTAGMVLQRHIVSDGKKQYLNVLYCLAQGRLDKIDNICLNSNPISNYKGMTVETRDGSYDQTVINNFNDSYADTSLSYELKPGGGWSTVKLNGNTAQGLELTIGFPGGMYYSNDSGGNDSTSVTLEAQYKKVSDTNWKTFPLTDNGKISANTNDAFYRVYRLYDLPAAQYEVRMRCTKKDGTTIRYVNKTMWEGVTQVIYDDFQYPGKALLGLKALATDQLSGSDPNMTCYVTRSTIYAWNPTTAKYEAKPADNPAWAAYDILHQCEKINGEYEASGVEKECMDYYAFEAWANQCDKANIKFNYLYDSAMQLWDALNYPARVGHGCIVVMGTKFSCVYDYASAPSQLFTVANIKKDSFKEEYQSAKERANAVEISYMNKDKDYERDVMTVFGEDYDADDTYSQPTQIELMGCTSAEQAYRYGQYRLRQNKYEIRTVSFDAYVDAIACTVGDVILVQEDLPEWGTGGRVVSVNGNVITLDKEIDTSYTKILIREQETDHIQTLNISKIDGANVTVDSTEGITKDAVYAAGKTGKEAKEFRVVAIERNVNEDTRTITALEYYPEIYSVDTDEVPATITYKNTIEPPSDLRLTAHAYAMALGNARFIIKATWKNPIEPNPIVVETALAGSTWVRRAKLERGEEEFSFEAGMNEEYTVRIYAENEIGKRSVMLANTISTKDGYSPATPVTKLYAYSRYRQTKDGVTKYNIVTTWEPDYQEAEVWYKTNHPEAAEVDEKSDTGDTVFGKTWIYAGRGKGQVVIPDAICGETYKIAVCTANGIGVFTLPDNAQQTTLRIMTKTTIPNMPDGVSVSFTDKAEISWNEVTNSDIVYYEIRSDEHPGVESDGLLARTNGLSATISLTKRHGTIYVYAKNTNGLYSIPAEYEYNLPKPKAPGLTLNATTGGFSMSVGYIPVGCLGAHFYIDDGKVIDSNTAISSYTCEPGIYNIKAAWYDYFGEGDKSGGKDVTVEIKISADMLENEAISLDKVNKEIAEALNAGVYAKKHVDIVTDNLSDPTEAAEHYAAIAHMADDIALRVKKDNIIAQINISQEGIQIDGQLIHITGDTLFDDNVIVNRMIEAKSISGDKLNVKSLSAICALIGELKTADSGARMVLKDNLIEVFDENNTRIVRIGKW